MNQAAVVIIDLQEDFLKPPQQGGGVASREKGFCLPGVEKLLEIARSRGWKVIHVGTRHDGFESLPLHLRKKRVPVYCLKGTSGAEFHFSPIAAETVLYKTHYGAFTNTGLRSELEGISDVVFAGVAADCCIMKSVFEADSLGFNCYLPFSCVSASCKEAYTFSLSSLAKSAAFLVDLVKLEDPSSSLDSATVDPEAMERLAEAWFSQNVTSEGDT